MPTLVQLRTRVRDWLNVSSTTRLPDSYINDLINEACREMARQFDLRYNEKLGQTVAMVQGTQAYALPSLVSRPIFCYLLDPDNTTQINVLKQRSYDEFRNLYGIATTAAQNDPADYCIEGNSATPLLVGPTPSRAATLVIDYYELPADLVADGDTNAYTTDTATSIGGAPWQAIVYKVLARACKFMLDFESVDQYEGEYMRLMSSIIQEDTRRHWSGKAFPQMNEPG